MAAGTDATAWVRNPPANTYTENSGDLTLTVTTNASNTGYTGSGTAIDMRPRRLNSVVWRRTA
jgi:hypothetical protein